MEVKGVYIVDRLEHLADCVGISPAFAKAVEFLEKNDLNSLAAGRHEIDGDNCFAIVNDEAELVAPAERKVEVLKLYQMMKRILSCVIGIMISVILSAQIKPITGTLLNIV